MPPADLYDIAVGDNLYCPAEGWSGEVVGVFCDEQGVPAAVVLKNHDPKVDHPWISMDIQAYRTAKDGEIGYH